MSDLLVDVASAKTGLDAFDRLSKSLGVSDFKSDVGYVKEQNGKFIALENGTNKPIGVDGGLVSSFSSTLYATKEDAQNAIKAREDRNKAYQPAPPKTDEEKQAEKTAKQKAREDKLQADREHTVELIGSLQFPDGYSARKFEQVRSGTGGAITDVFVQVVGKYDDDLHKRIKKEGGWWDGTTGGNTKTWLIPIEKADLLEKVFKNTKKSKDKAAKEQSLENEPRRTLWGDTFHIKDELQSRFNAKWDGNRWSVPQSKWEESKQFMRDNPKPKVTQSPHKPSSQSSTSYIPLNDVGQDFPEWIRESDLQ